MDLPIYFLADTPSDQNGSPHSSGGICNPGSNFIVLYTGYVIEVPSPSWGGIDDYFVNGTLVHEYGHQLTARHLPDPRNCASNGCGGGYFGCYGAMNWAQLQGCGAIEDMNGLIPYHPFNTIKFGWWDVDTLDEDVTDYVLGDVRIYGEVAKVPVPGESNEYFLLVNHQRTLYDDVLNGRGVLIWHVRENSDATVDCGSNDNHIIDLEAHSGRYEPDGTGVCFDRPLEVDASSGIDSLDVSPTLLPSAFYPGVVAGGGITYDFDKDRNPNSNKYGSGATSRRSSQADTSGIYIEDLEAVADGVHAGKYKIKFDLKLYE